MRYVYNFSVDCNTTDIGDILDIHKYLTEKYNTIDSNGIQTQKQLVRIWFSV